MAFSFLSSPPCNGISLTVDSDYVENFRKLLRPLNLKVVPMEHNNTSSGNEVQVLKRVIAEKDESVRVLKEENILLRRELVEIKNHVEKWKRNERRFLELLINSAEDTFPKELIYNALSSEIHYKSVMEHVEKFFNTPNKECGDYQKFKKHLLKLVQGASTVDFNQQPGSSSLSTTSFNGYILPDSFVLPETPSTSFNSTVECPIYVNNHHPHIPNLPVPPASIIVELGQQPSPRNKNVTTKMGFEFDAVDHRNIRSNNPVTTSASSQAETQLFTPIPAKKKPSQQSKMRKLQSEILKRKKHAVFTIRSNSTTLSLSTQNYGCSWWCICGSKFTSKCKLLTHVQYFTQDWKFRCEVGYCRQTFLYLAQLKKHMASAHEILEPLKEYVTGCHYCGEMFISGVLYGEHKKHAHNLYPQQRNRPPANRSFANKMTGETWDEIIDLTLDDEQDFESD